MTQRVLTTSDGDIMFHVLTFNERFGDYTVLRQIRQWCFKNKVSICKDGKNFYFPDENMQTLFLLTWFNEITQTD